MEGSEQPEMDRLLAELRHPLRRRLLRLMLEAEQPRSPTELAREVEVTLSTVAYHVRVLAGCGALELVEERHSRGSIMHFYRATGNAARARQALRLEEDEDGQTREGIS